MIGKQLEYSELLPPSWAVKTVGDIGSYLNGFAFKPAQWGSAGLPIIRIQNLNDRNKPFNYYDGEVLEKYRIRDGDILISWSASLGTYRWNRGDAWLNQHIFKATPNLEELSDEFFYWVMVHGIERIAGNARGSTMKHVTGKEFANSQVAIPPLPEQKKIAHILSTVQRAIEAQERIIQATIELKKALMHKLFTEGLRNEPQKQTEIGSVPESWEVVELGTLAKIGNGSTPKRANNAYWEDGTVPWLNSTKIHDRFITEADQFVTPQAVKECHLPNVAPNSLLIAITGQGKTLGNSAITRIETCINQHLAYAQFHSAKIVPDFVLWFMQTRYEYLRSIAHGGGSTKGALTCGFLKTLSIPVPSTEEQKEIVTVFQTLEDKQGSAASKQSALQNLFRTLLHELMTAKTRVHDIEIPAFNLVENR